MESQQMRAAAAGGAAWQTAAAVCANGWRRWAGDNVATAAINK